MRRKQILKVLFFALIIFFAFGFFSFFYIEAFSSKYISYNVYSLPKCNTALVLGTSRKLASGTENLYFTYRIVAAEKLFKTKKVRQMILSGDNRKDNYNEPREMKKALVHRGIPEESLIADYAGLRTFDSMVRSNKIFGQDTVIVVSQQFHNARAVFIGRKTGLTVYGYNADKVTTQKSYKILLREFFSRIKCILDIYLLHTQPKHLGEKITID